MQKECVIFPAECVKALWVKLSRNAWHPTKGAERKGDLRSKNRVQGMDNGAAAPQRSPSGGSNAFRSSDVMPRNSRSPSVALCRPSHPDPQPKVRTCNGQCKATSLVEARISFGADCPGEFCPICRAQYLCGPQLAWRWRPGIKLRQRPGCRAVRYRTDSSKQANTSRSRLRPGTPSREPSKHPSMNDKIEPSDQPPQRDVVRRSIPEKH
jgi:hypothetical protein